MGRKRLAEGEEGGGESGDVNRMGGFFGCVIGGREYLFVKQMSWLASDQRELLGFQ